MRKVDRLFSIPEYNGPGVYAIKNINNNKIYIGSSIHVNQRLKAHEYSFRSGSCCKKIWIDIDCGYFFEAMVLEKMDETVDEKTLRGAESRHISLVPKDMLYNDDRHRPYPLLKYSGLEEESDTPWYIEKRGEKRIKTVISQEERDEIHADAAGQSNQKYILQAVMERMEREKESEICHK